MKVAIVSHWLCLKCGADGTYEEPDTTTDTAPAAKHLRDAKRPHGCVGATVSACDPAVLARLRERVAS